MNIVTPVRDLDAAGALEGKVSLVTGSTSGIGLAIARALAAQGSAVVLNGFGDRQEVAETTAKLTSDYAVHAFHSPADMTRPAEIQEMIETTVETYGQLDILVNNAGIRHVAPIQEFPVA